MLQTFKPPDYTGFCYNQILPASVSHLAQAAVEAPEDEAVEAAFSFVNGDKASQEWKIPHITTM